jgi:hypothetical protein
MSRQRSIQPGLESLEGRLVLSRAGFVTLGALGDSYSAEYQASPTIVRHAMNWVEILATTRRAGFGPTSAHRGAPRGGFAFDWAQPDASSTDVVRQQLPGLARQVASGRVPISVLFFGGIDYLSYARSLALTANGVTPAQHASSVAAVTAKATANFDTAVSTLLAANPNARLVVATLPTFTILPIVQDYASLAGFPAAVSAIEQGRQEFNDHIRLVAAANDRVALADLDNIVSPLAAVPDAMFPFGDTTIDVATPGDDPRDLFLSDGLHAGTVAQGIIANAFVDAINREFGLQVPAVGEGYVLRLAAFAARGAR